jgi:mannitol-1-/sugar-/sorbitol-6-phosphatase
VGLIAPDAPSKLGSLGPLGRLSKQGAGLLLDLDGTLVDSESVHRDAYRRYFAERGWQVEDQVLAQFSGRRAPEVFATLAGPWSGQDPVELTEGVLDALAASRVAPAPVAGAVRLIEACTRTGLPVAVVTSARRWWARAALDQFGVGEDPMMVEGIPMVTSENCECGKPDPQPYRLGADLLGLRPADLVAAEDAPAGVTSARAAGIGHVIGITTSLSAQVLRDAGAHSSAPDLVALARAVEQLNRAR